MNQTSATKIRTAFPAHDGSARRQAQQSLRSNVRLSLAEGSAFSLMVGMGETYLPAFAIWMGLGGVLSGLVTTLPLLAGSLLQLGAPFMVRRLGSYRKWVVLCATVQASTFLPLVVCAYLGHLPVALVFLTASAYWAAGLGASGAWNSWMGTLIPPSIHVGFFTKRTRITQATVFVGFAVGGVVLHNLPSYVDKRWAYIALFLAAFACRMLSIRWLMRQTEPLPPPSDFRVSFGLKEFSNRLHRGHEQGRLFTYLLSVTFAAHLAAPFFTSYMLAELGLHYSTYAILVATSYLTKVLLLPYLGRMAVSRGTRPLLILGGYGIILLPALWLISSAPPYLIFLQALSGFAWGAYELASLLLLWELVKPEERTCALATYNVCNSAAMSAGSLLGGFMLFYFGADARAFAIVFGVSTVARAATLTLLKGISSHRLRWLPIGFRTLTLRPSFGSIMLPIAGWTKSWKRRRPGQKSDD